MLLRSSALVYPGLFLITLGNSCRYVIAGDPHALVVCDPGASCHVSLLEQRLGGLKLAMRDIRHAVLTHLDADRAAGIPLLRRLSPRLQVHGTTAMHNFLLQEQNIKSMWEEDRALWSLFHGQGSTPPLTYSEFKEGLRIDKHIVESDTIGSSDDIALRVVATPGHRAHSTAYLVLPHEFVIADETFGYYQGRRLAAPGGDADLNAAVTSIKKFSHIEVSGIGFSYGGAITGDIVRKHLDAVIQNTEDLIHETRTACASGVPDEETRAQIREAFYTSSSRDPIVLRSLERSFESVWKQLIVLRGAAPIEAPPSAE